MNYIVDIIDTKTNILLTRDEKAVAASLNLEWKGGDKKDDLIIVGSALGFTMLGMSCEDGQYQDLFTGDETRFKVRLYDGNDVTIWTGFILPESYSEPYRDNPIPISFTATDGLGRLKGKYLPQDYYEDEKSVIDILSKCLSLTGLDLDIRFAPAIENSIQKDYNLIYKDGLEFIDKDKKQDVYSILEELLSDMQCLIYQDNNYFNIEGLNVRNFRVYKTKVYDINGAFKELQEVTRLRKDITGIATPQITMQPPYGVVEVRHKREDISLPKTVSTEENDGWVLSRGYFNYIYATDWFGQAGFYAKAAEYKDDPYSNIGERENYKVYFEKGLPDTEFMVLRNRPYIKKGNKYKLNLDFKIIPYYDLTEVTVDTMMQQGFWTDPFKVQISILSAGDVVNVLFANYGVTGEDKLISQVFNDQGVFKNELDFIAPIDGVFDIQINAIKNISNAIEFVSIEKAGIESINFKQEYLAERTLTEDYTAKNEVTLITADDSTGFSKAFRLKKLREKLNKNNMGISLLRTFPRDGFFYSIVSLQDANIAADNIKDIYDAAIGGNNIQIEEVIYNYKNSDEHAIRFASDPGVVLLYVFVYDFNAVKEDRTYWEEWTDSIFKVERIRYPEVVANIKHRLFDKPVPKGDFLLKNNVKFGDFINFNFAGEKQFLITNCNWNIDRGNTDVTIIENYYAVNTGTNIPPVVEAGNDINFSELDTSLTITAEAFDPDGFIVSYFWEILQGTGASMTNPNDSTIEIENLTDDYYVLQVTVTDNEGATATDTLQLFKVINHEISLTQVSTGTYENHYQVVFNPDIAEGATLTLQGVYKVSLFRNSGEGSAHVKISVNGTYSRATVFNNQFYNYITNNDSATENFNISYTKGDVVIFELRADPGSGVNPDTAYADFTIETVTYVDGNGTISGLPQHKFEN